MNTDSRDAWIANRPRRHVLPWGTVAVSVGLALTAHGAALAAEPDQERDNPPPPEREREVDRERDEAPREGDQVRKNAEAGAKKKEAVGREQADPNFELGERMLEMAREVQALNRNGHHDEANRLQEKLMAMMREHPEVGRKVRATVGGPFGPGGPRGPVPDRPEAGGPGPMMMERIERALAEARERGDQQMIAQLERKLHSAREMMGREGSSPAPHEGDHGRPHPEQDEAMRRVRHLHEAAAHLDAVGMHDVSERLRNQAREIEAHHARQSHHHSPHEPGHQPADDRVQRQLEEMRHAIEQLRRELREVSERIHR